MENEKAPEQKPGEDEQLAGLLKNRDAILAEKKTLQDRLSAAETEREALKGKLAQYEPKVTFPRLKRRGPIEDPSEG